MSSQLTKLYLQMRGICRPALAAKILDSNPLTKFDFDGDAADAELDNLLVAFELLTPYWQPEVLRYARDQCKPTYSGDRKQLKRTKADGI